VPDLLRLNLGSGPTPYKGWYSVDFDERYKPALLADVSNLPLEDACVDAIFASHILEHFPHDQDVLGEWNRVLKPGGDIIVAVPNPLGVYREYKQGREWGDADYHRVVDIAYINACVFGAHVLGDVFTGMEKNHTHKQVFFEDMLVERMRVYFPDAHEIGECELRRASSSEFMVRGTKP
jgi:predicted SAM-dependent methyltransferase